jgi:U3 small nucleolar RNA-associated protein 23
MNNKKLHKHNKKNIKLLKKDGFREPFQLLLDNSFIQKVNQYKKRYKHLTEFFKHEPKLFITKCAFTAYKATDPTFKADISDNCQIINCKHSNEEILKCFKKFFKKGNKHNYILCTSSKDVLKEFADKIPVLNFSKGLFKIHMETNHIERYKGLPKEATPEELERLKTIFEEEVNTEEDKLKHENVNFDELEESSDTCEDDDSSNESSDSNEDSD